MIARVILNQAYRYQNERVVVIRRHKNPWMPDTLTIRFEDRRTQEVSVKTFRQLAEKTP